MRKATVLAALLAAAVAVPATAQTLTVNAGIDLWETAASGAYISFADNPIPAGTFCANSPAFSGNIPVTGRRFSATPDLGTTDTVIEREQNVTLTVGGNPVISNMRMRVLSVAGTFSACGVTWVVDAYAADGKQINSTISIRAVTASGGTFDADLNVVGTVRFVSSLGTVKLEDKVNLKTTAACWSTSTRTGIKVAGPVKVDSDADGVQDLALPGTSNFHPGWCGGTPVQVTHTGPHPVKPPGPCAVATAFSEDKTDSRAVAQPLPICPKPVIITEAQPIKVIEISQQF